jgi:hypothetical protein
MRSWSNRHPIAAALAAAAALLAAVEGILVCYYLNSWFTMPLL